LKGDFFDSFNGWRYPLVGGTRQRHFDGAHSRPHKLIENAQTPTSRVLAVLGCLIYQTNHMLKQQYKNVELFFREVTLDFYLTFGNGSKR
jgi:hypothetical protein